MAIRAVAPSPRRCCSGSHHTAVEPWRLPGSGVSRELGRSAAAQGSSRPALGPPRLPPEPALELAGHLVESFSRRATGRSVPVAATVTVLGRALIAASLFRGRLPPGVRRILPER